jgi:osmotically-inducible protein OsmY
MMKDDARLHADIAEELQTDPSVDASRIAVAVHNGVVTLTGSVPSYWQKIEAENAVKRVSGVRAVANELQVELPGDHVRDDADIAQAAAMALSWHSDLPDNIQVTVSNGWITLSGTVDWQFQRTEAENAVRNIRGVRGVINNITLKTAPKVTDVKERIKKELERTVEQDVDRITVETSNGKVTLRGTVHSWFEDSAARRAAWSVPGVTAVEDHLVVEPV